MFKRSKFGKQIMTNNDVAMTFHAKSLPQLIFDLICTQISNYQSATMSKVMLY